MSCGWPTPCSAPPPPLFLTLFGIFNPLLPSLYILSTPPLLGTLTKTQAGALRAEAEGEAVDAVLGVVEVGLAVVLKAVDPINLSPTMLPQQQPASDSVLFGEHLVAGTPPPLIFMAAEEAEEGAAFPAEAEEEEGVIPSHLAVVTVMEVSMEPSALEGRQKEPFYFICAK